MIPLAQLYPQLFWDVDISKLDWDKHQLLIIERVIERGTYKAFKLTEQHYGEKEMGQIIRKFPFMHPKDMAFVHTYFNIPLIELKCYIKKPLTPGFLS
jgi:hypothetical protein